MKNHLPTIFVIFGITGDLSTRKLLPAISEILAADVLPDQFKILGISRKTNIDLGSHLKNVKNKKFLLDNTELFSMDNNVQEEYEKLADKIDNIKKDFGKEAQVLIYLSLPPDISEKVISKIGISSLNKERKIKLLLEKPFGMDFLTAENLINEINKNFLSEQIYRVDHYLAKEMAQNVLIFKQDNSLFRRTWNKDFIEKIQIVAFEEIGIEGRVNFYENTGALRDLVQSHLLQLTALTLMDNVGEKGIDSPQKRLEALQALNIIENKQEGSILRGQYEGYREEVNNINSKTETFVKIKIESTNEKWKGVPIEIITGKALNKKITEIRIFYSKEGDKEANELVLSLQPNEGVRVSLWAKVPGYDRKVEKHVLHFTYKDIYPSLPEAYEQVLLDAINSDHSLFITSEEILESWRIVSKAQEYFIKPETPLFFYKKGIDPQEFLKEIDNI